MAETEITVQENSPAGIVVTYTAFAQDIYGEGMKFKNTGRETIRIKQGTGARVLTVENPTTVDGLAVADRTVSVSASSIKEIGPFKKSYNDNDGYVHLTVDATTNTEIAVVRQP